MMKYGTKPTIGFYRVFQMKEENSGFHSVCLMVKKTWINTRSLYIDSNAVAFSIGADVASEGGVPGVDEDGNPVLVIMEL